MNNFIKKGLYNLIYIYVMLLFLVQRSYFKINKLRIENPSYKSS